jgi:hypothetical protein
MKILKIEATTERGVNLGDFEIIHCRTSIEAELDLDDDEAEVRTQLRDLVHEELNLMVTAEVMSTIRRRKGLPPGTMRNPEEAAARTDAALRAFGA